MLLKIKLHSLVSKIFSLFSTPNHTTGQAEFQEFTPIISSGSRRIRNLIFIIFCFIFSLFSYPNYANATSEYEVVFSEVMWMGSSVSTADEWIELKNTTVGNIDLSGWQITHLKENSETGLWEEKLMLAIPSGVIPTGGYFLISSHAKDHQFTGGQSILNIDPDLVDSSVSLSNTKLQLKLYDGQWDDGRNPIDIAGAGSNPASFAGSNLNPKASMQRLIPITDGNLSSSWQTTISQENLDITATELATPHSSGKPKIVSPTISPSSLNKSQATNVQITAEVSDPDGATDIQSVTVNLSSINGQTDQTMYNDGTNGDQVAGDVIYSFSFVGSIDIYCGQKTFPITVKDQKKLISSQNINLDVYQLSDQIVINEIMPWPSTGSTDEFIELYNKGSTSVDLYKWQIDDKDGGNSPYKITDSVIIKSGEYLVFKNLVTGISLNNSDSDQARLIRPDGKVVSYSNFYDKAYKDQSYNLTNVGDWLWSITVTPGKENIVTQSEDIKDSNESNDSKQPNVPIPISQARSIQEGKEVIVEGVVTALPGTFDKQYFYIQDDSGGIQIYSYYERFPSNLGLGDWIRVTGELSSTQNGNRIKTSNEMDIEILKIGQPAYVWELSNHQANNGYEGQLVKIRGQVKKIEGNKIYLDDGQEELVIYIDAYTKITISEISVRDKLEVQGIITIYENKNQLNPRFQNDISVTKSVEPIYNNKSQTNLATVQEKWYDFFIGLAKATEADFVSIKDQGEILGEKINRIAGESGSKYKNQKTKKIKQSITITKLFIATTFVVLVFLIGEFLWSKQLSPEVLTKLKK